MDNNSRRKLCFLVIFVIVLGVILGLMVQKKDGDDGVLTYDELIIAVKDGEISKVVANESTLTVQLTMKDESQKFSVIPSLDEFSSLITKEIENGAKIKYEITSMPELTKIISSMASLFIMIGFFIYMIRRMEGGNYSFKPVKSTTLFSDVAGIDEEKAQLQEIVSFLKNPEKYQRIGAKIPKGILLNGEPGTGKTLLARAIAGEAGVPFFQANGSSFEEKFVGVGASKIRKLFSTARKVAPCIIFIDEIDSVAQNRYSGNTYSEQTLNQLLAEMDGFEVSENVIVIAATNHIEVLDSAITRPGRFDRHVFIPKPDVNARQEILAIHSRNKSFSDDVSLYEVAKKTVGFSGADLENVLNEAAIQSVNMERENISMADIDEAIARVLVGLKKENAVVTDEEKRLTAVHEAGHAIVSAVLRPEVKNFGISIIPRGNAGGYNIFDEADCRFVSKSDLLLQMQVMYGGRIAEEVILGDISNGASNDLERASKIAHTMVTRYSMNGSLLSKISGEAKFNELLDEKVIYEAEVICRENYDKAKEVVEKHKELIIKLSDFLFEREYLSQKDVEEFMSDNL